MEENSIEFIKQERWFQSLNLPWYFDTFNEKEIIINDNRGNLVYYESLKGIQTESCIQEKKDNAMFMVKMSELFQ